MRRNFSAFTLAEVLITLGIIGVVAAMTMPTLMNSTQGAQYKAAYKKALSALSQAVTLNVALDDWNFADTTKNEIDTTAGKQNIYKLITDRMNYVKTETTTPTIYNSTNLKDGSNPDEKISNLKADTYIYFNDGMMFAYAKGQGECKKDSPCFGFVDVNGEKGPNKVTVCSGTYALDSTNTDAEDEESAAGTFGKLYDKSTCTEVSNPTDIYPVVFYDQTVLPNSAAGRLILYSK